jgi:Recombinase zinc beta ribbon domain
MLAAIYARYGSENQRPESIEDQVTACRRLAGQRGFSAQQGSREKYFPTHLLSGAMVCGKCGATIAQVSGKGGGYYGCIGATKGACDNKLLVRRSLSREDRSRYDPGGAF